MFDFLGEAVGAIGSGVFGGVLGLVGNYFTEKQKQKTQVIKNTQELAMANIDLEESKLERTHALDMADKKVEGIQAEGEIALDVAETNAFAESMKNSTKPSGIRWIDGFRAFQRPGITDYLLAVSTLLCFEILSILGGLDSIPKDQLVELLITIIKDVLFLTITCTTWWFASRRTSR